MITGGSTANLAIILVDARTGVITQTRRHSYLVSLLGIRHIVLAVNKMDLVDYDESRFLEIVGAYKRWIASQQLDIPDLGASRSRLSRATMSSNAVPACPGMRARRCCIFSSRFRSSRTSICMISGSPYNMCCGPMPIFRGYSGENRFGIVRQGRSGRSPSFGPHFAHCTHRYPRRRSGGGLRSAIRNVHAGRRDRPFAG